MRKLHFLVLMAVVILSACSKSEYLAKEKELLLDEISNVVTKSVQVTSFNDVMVTNCNNPYDVVGEITGQVSSKILNKIAEQKTDPDSLKIEFLSLLENSIPLSFQLIDTSDIQSIESEIADRLVNIYISEGFEVFVIKSKEIEDIIYKSLCFNENQKARLLIFSSVLRQNIDAVKIWFEENNGKGKSDWEKCFMEKLRELEDCGNCFFERLYCIVSWPTCLGIKALDCAVDAIIN
jgi:hypothetical protein